MKTSDFDFEFPKELIAQEPAEKRDHSRLMVLNRQTQSMEHKYFYEIINYLQPGDLLVLNDTKVIPANLCGIKENGGAKIEVLLVKKYEDKSPEQVWLCLVKPGKRLKVGSRIIFGSGELVGVVKEKLETGEQVIGFKIQKEEFQKFENSRTFEPFRQIIYRLGEIPLPPYINPKFEARNSKQIKSLKSELSKRYQTVYGRKDGASASPTAGLHFTHELLEKIKSKGVKITYVTLHTGLATFKPVYEEEVEKHKMHSEYFEISKETFEAVEKAKKVIAVGTTVVRALETAFSSSPPKLYGETDLFIYPGYKFKRVDALITNFHWPRSTLIMLVSAFAGRDFIMKAYREAIDRKYRFFSFGDAMLIV